MVGAAWWFLVGWIALLGGLIGSFLNVVVYRLPRSKNLAYPGSACPRCGHPIRWYHNVPVFGWLMLGGKCFDCRAPIAPRYPLVEGIVSLVFAAAAITGPLNGGASWPHERLSASPLGDFELFSVFGYQMLLLCTLLASALIEFDGAYLQPGETWRFPWSLLAFPLLVGVIAPVGMPLLHPLPLLHAPPHWLLNSPGLEALATGIAGGLAGLAAGGLAYPATGLAALRLRGRFIAMGNAALVGVFLGWQSVAMLVLATTFLYFFVVFMSLAYPELRRLPWSIVLFAITSFFVVTWSALFDHYPLLGAATDSKLAATFVVVLVSVPALSFWIWLLARRWPG